MSSFWIKTLALLFMIVDHTGVLIFPNLIELRIIGRLALPLFAFQMAIGAKNTHNLERRIIKLLLFASIVQIPYLYFLNLANIEPDLNIIFTFVISLLIILIPKRIKPDSFKNKLIDTLLIGLVLSLNLLLSIDYGLYGILLVLLLYYCFEHKIAMITLFVTLIIANYIINPSTMHLLAIASIFDIVFFISYNGKKGYNKGYFFYLAYFLHFIVLTIIYQFVR